jgi:hypothetical protein
LQSLPTDCTVPYSPGHSIHRCLPFLKRNRVGAFCWGGRIGGTRDYLLRRVMFIFCNEIICPFLFSPLRGPCSIIRSLASVFARRYSSDVDNRSQYLGDWGNPLSWHDWCVYTYEPETQSGTHLSLIASGSTLVSIGTAWNHTGRYTHRLL